MFTARVKQSLSLVDLSGGIFAISYANNLFDLILLYFSLWKDQSKWKYHEVKSLLLFSNSQ